MKLTLTIGDGSLAGKIFDLEAGHLTIGRNPNCSVRFDPFAEKIVSGQHAFLEAKPDGFYLTDNSSTNGTFVNGQRVQNVKLTSGDTLQFGKNGITGKVLIEDSAPLTSSDLPTVSYQPESPVEVAQLSQINQKVYQQKLEPQSIVNSVSTLGLGRLEVEPERSNTGKYIGIALTVFGVVFLGLIVTGILFLSLGPVAAIVAAVVAFTPAIIYLFPIIWLDRYDPEPLWLLSLAFAWGALLAVLISIVVNSMIGAAVTIAVGEQAGGLAGAVISAPLFEEISKGAGLLVIVLFLRKYFDGILDGIIFAGVIALGFATVENVLYYGRALNLGGAEGLRQVFFLRGVLSPFAHVTFTAMTGIGFGLARETHNSLLKYIFPIAGLVLAIALHAFWNGVAYLFGPVFFLVYLFIEIPFFLLFWIFAFLIMFRQNRILKEMLAIDVARGLIPEEDFKWATSAFLSTGWIIGSAFKLNCRATINYIRAIGKLGLSYWHIQRATAAQGETASFQQNPILRAEVEKWRDRV